MLNLLRIYGRSFCQPWNVQGWMHEGFKKIKKGQFQLCYANLALLNQDCKYVLLLVQVFAIVQMWSQLRVTRRVCVKGTVT